MDFKKLVKDKKTEEKDLYQRYKDDRDLIYKAYTLKDVNEHAIPNSISVTLNDLLVFAVNVESALGNASEQVNIETDSKQLDTAYIEDFLTAAFKMADKRLVKMGRYAFNPFIDQQMCRRGRGLARCLFRVVNGELIADLSPWDAGYSYYSIGHDGLQWAVFEGKRPKDLVLAEYPDAKISSTGNMVSVLDCWNKEHYEILVDNKKVAEREHPYRYTPLAVQVVPMGAMTADEDDLKRHGESVFFLVRDLMPELNRLVSIIQSLNQKALDSPLLFRSPLGSGAEPPDHDKLTEPSAITPVDEKTTIDPVFYGEIKRSAYLLQQMIEQRIRWGTMEVVGVGDLPGALSAVALIEIGEGKDQIFLPRLGSRGLLKQQVAEMLLEQTISTAKGEGSSTVEVGTPGHKRKFDIAKLEGEYEVSYKFFIKSPKIDAARYSMAAAAGDLIPDRYKRRDIIQLEDPDDAERWLRWEEAERLSPAIKINRTIRALTEMAKRGDKSAELEAEILSNEMGVSLKQMLAGNVSQLPTPEKEQKPQPLAPMFGNQVSSAKKAAQLQAEPREGSE